MKDERIEELRGMGVECRYVLRIPHEYKAELAERINGNENPDVTYELREMIPAARQIMLRNDPRTVVSWEAYQKDMVRAAECIAKDQEFESDERVCVIGTEEFMYMMFCLGGYMLSEKLVKEVRIHSTTRSPIVPSSQEGYPLHDRYRLESFYAEDRVAYIYDLARYDRVIIVTDGSCRGKGIQSLISAVRKAGNDAVSVYGCVYEK
mgnify:CR=1 FL=1